MPPIKYALRYPVTQNECPWLSRDFGEGEEVYAFLGCTYGCVSPKGEAVTLVAGEGPFFELPASALVEIG